MVFDTFYECLRCQTLLLLLPLLLCFSNNGNRQTVTCSRPINQRLMKTLVHLYYTVEFSMEMLREGAERFARQGRPGTKWSIVYQKLFNKFQFERYLLRWKRRLEIKESSWLHLCLAHFFTYCITNVHVLQSRVISRMFPNFTFNKVNDMSERPRLWYGSTCKQCSLLMWTHIYSEDVAGVTFKALCSLWLTKCILLRSLATAWPGLDCFRLKYVYCILEF